MSDLKTVREALEQIAGNEWTCYAHTGDVHQDCAVSMAREALAALSRLEAQQQPRPNIAAVRERLEVIRRETVTVGADYGVPHAAKLAEEALAYLTEAQQSPGWTPKLGQDPYSVTLHRDEDGDWVARIPELPGCSSHGSTEAEAIARVREAQQLWLADARSVGDEIPSPVMLESPRRQAAPPVEPCPARKALEKAPCGCRKTVKANNCPQCGELLWPVVYRGGALNEEQFMAVRAGDYYCKSCKGEEGNTGSKYFCERDFEVRIERCERCVALASPCSPCPRCDRLQATVKALVEGLREIASCPGSNEESQWCALRATELVAEHAQEKAADCAAGPVEG